MAQKTIEQLEADLADLQKKYNNLEQENDQLREQLEAGKEETDREKAISAKINASGGALSRAQAILALDNQAAHDAATKKAAAKRK